MDNSKRYGWSDLVLAVLGAMLCMEIGMILNTLSVPRREIKAIAVPQEAGRLRLSSPNGKHSITLLATDDGCTIRIENKESGKHVSMMSCKHHAAVGIYTETKTGWPFTVGLAEDKFGPAIQFMDKAGKFKHVEMKDFDKPK